MNSPGRVFRTADDELVLQDHPDAAFLLYAKDDELEKRDEKAVRELFAEAAPVVEEKSMEKPQDKAAPKPSDK